MTEPNEQQSPQPGPVYSPGAAEVAYPSYQDPTQGYSTQGYPTQGYPYGPSAYPPPGYPPAYPAPSRKRRTGLIVTLVLVLVLLVLGSGSAGAYFLLKDRIGGNAGGAATPSATGTAARPTATPSPTAKPFDGDLRDLLLPKPAGAQDPAEPISPNGRLTASQVAAQYQDPSAMLDILEARKFQQGAIGEYRVGDDMGVTIELLQFGDPAKANGMAADLQFGYGRDPDLQEKKFIDGIPLGQVYLFKKDKTSAFMLSIAVFSKGDIFCSITVFEKRAAPSATTVSKLSQDQFAKLP